MQDSGRPRKLPRTRAFLQGIFKPVLSFSREPSGRDLGRLVAVPRRLGAVLGPSWGSLEPT